MPDGVRIAQPHDAAEIAAIYAPIVTGTWISFEEVPPDETSMRGRIEAAAGVLPFLAYEREGAVAGYAYASRHRERASYRWSVDCSAYVRADVRRGGVARALYEVLFALLARQGYYNLFAGITLPNDPSVAFHRTLGFEDVGRYRNVGFKLGAWRDTLWLQRVLREPDSHPEEPLRLDQLESRTLLG
jgi:phosphinothricin acetyltransferase